MGLGCTYSPRAAPCLFGKLSEQHFGADFVCVLLSCRYDGTVRNSAGDVVQFLYGEDGMDGVRIEGQVRIV